MAVDQIRRLEQSADAWEEIVHRKQVALEEIAGIMQRLLDANYVSEDQMSIHRSWALNRMKEIVKREVEGDWGRFSMRMRISDRLEDIARALAVLAAQVAKIAVMMMEVRKREPGEISLPFGGSSELRNEDSHELRKAEEVDAAGCKPFNTQVSSCVSDAGV